MCVLRCEREYVRECAARCAGAWVMAGLAVLVWLLGVPVLALGIPRFPGQVKAPVVLQ